MAASYYEGVLGGAHGWQKGRKSGGSSGCQVLSWRAPISIVPNPAVTEFEMKSPDANPGDLMIRDCREKDIAEGSGKLVLGPRSKGSSCQIVIS